MAGICIGDYMKEHGIRKCAFCKECIDTINDKDFFVERTVRTTKKDKKEIKTNKFIHDKCYIKYETETKTRGKKTIEECLEYIEDKKLEETEYLKSQTTKEELYSFISDMYDIKVLPNRFYIKMAEIFNGNYKNVTAPIPPEDLLDMWKQKKNTLLKMADNNIKKGKEFNKPINRADYDLAVLLSRYDSYLSWKEQQKIALAELNEKKKTDLEVINYNEIKRPKKVENNTVVDIASMLDEI